MKRVGRDTSAIEKWEDVAAQYASTIEGGYHRHRLKVISALLPDLKGKTVVDFGCGDGVLAELAVQHGAAKIYGIDPVPSLLEIARKRVPSGDFFCGTAAHLAGIPQCDVVIAANVLAYLTDAEEGLFYREAKRLGVHLVVTHSNELFDLYTLNAYSVDFFRRSFDCDISGLLRQPNKPSRTSFNVRENPLSYPAKMKKLGFTVERMEFMNRHLAPPLLTNDDPDDMQRERQETLGLDESEKWKLMFQCSMFGVLARSI